MNLSETSQEISTLISILKNNRFECNLSELVQCFRNTHVFNNSSRIQMAFKKHGPANVLEAYPQIFILTRDASSVTVRLASEHKFICWIKDHLETHTRATVNDLAKSLRDTFPVSYPFVFRTIRPGEFLKKYAGTHWNYHPSTNNTPFVTVLEGPHTQEFPCPQSGCGRVFSSQDAMKQHYFSQHRFPCPTCGDNFSTEEDLEEHVEEYHTFHCDECSEEFSDEYQLDYHIEEAHTEYECDYCIRSFQTEAARRMHTNAVHLRSTQCHICSKKFPTEPAFETHMSKTHWTSDSLKPPVDNDGEWLSRKELEDAGTSAEKKSYGAFDCHHCSKKWYSAHTYFGYAQGCKRCERFSKPSWMWKNSSTTFRDKVIRRDEDEQPHDIERCQACQAGICVFKRRDLVEEASSYSCSSEESSEDPPPRYSGPSVKTQTPSYSTTRPKSQTVETWSWPSNPPTPKPSYEASPVHRPVFVPQPPPPSNPSCVIL